MKLKLTGNVGLSKSGDAFYTRTDEQGQALIDKGLAEVHPEQDVELPELKRELYQSENGSWHTRDNHGGDSGKVEADAEPTPTPDTETVVEETKPKKVKE